MLYQTIEIGEGIRIWDVVQPNILVPLYSTKEVKRITFLLLTSHIKFSLGFFVNSFILIVSHFYNFKGSCSFQTYSSILLFFRYLHLFLNQIPFRIRSNQNIFRFQKRKSVYFSFAKFIVKK